jgi:flagellar biosynthesis protein FlhF
MKIVRHVARDMRQAMRAIRERLGEDAVILSSRRVGDGVEVTAAVDFDAAALEAQAMQQQAAERLPPPVTVTSEPDEDQLIREDLAQIIRGATAPVAQTLAAAPARAPAVALVASTVAARIPPPAAPVAPVAVAAQAFAAPAAQAAPATRAQVAQLAAVRGGDATPRPLAPHASAPEPTAVRDSSGPDAHLDYDLDALVEEAVASPPPPAGHSDAVGSELKTLRRMLETQLAQLAWNDMTRRAPIRVEMLRELTEIGISQELAGHITGQLPENTDLTYARRFAIAALSQYLLVTGDRWLEDGGRVAFIGATGVGKTTTIAKLAVRWVLRHGAKDLALVAADQVRLGAQDQMQALGQLLGAPVYVPEHFETLPTLLSRLQQRFILIDTPGSSLRDTQLTSRLAVLANCASQLQTALVLAASTQAGALEEAVKRFAPANPCCCLLTKLDEAASLGGALSVLIRSRIPVSYVSEGQRIPEDLRPARALELVSNAVRLAKTTGAAADEDLLRRRFGKIAHAST